MNAQLDHLVVAADTLEAGARWCRQTLGVAPGPGGRHPLFGTHNLLLNVSSPVFPRSYLEIIAIDPEAQPAPGADGRPRARWFDLDDAALRQRLRVQGPQLLHWVVRVPDLDAAVTALAVQGVDRGDVLAASRDTPSGELHWKISVRPDGQRLFDGMLPTLIEWGGAHPTDALPASGIALTGAAMVHPRASVLSSVCQAAGLGRVPVHSGPQRGSRLNFTTPGGPVTLKTGDARWAQ